MRKYPIGLQDFRKIRENGFLYVDKTEIIHTLIESGSYYFLSRPRRFGKSLLISTIREILQGSKELFTGLWIENHWNWEQSHPVIHISFSSIGVQSLGLSQAIFDSLQENAERLGIHLEKRSIDQQFKELIRKSSKFGKVVILIDEYDKPIIDNLFHISIAENNVAIFKNFYSILKDADEYIRLLLITGVSKFSKVSIFSDLNNLQDITLSSTYSKLTGITQIELETNFSLEIEELKIGNPDILTDLQNWYNGYSWNGSQRLYNPFSLLNFMSDREFRNYWFATGTPTFLIEQMKNKREGVYPDIRIGELALGNLTIDRIETIPLLFQTGYLTIKWYDALNQTYSLDYPNKEVKSSFMDALLSSYREVFPGDSMAITGDLRTSLLIGDVPKIIEVLNSIISTIPYDHWKSDSESIFHILFHLTFMKIGVDIQSEVHSSKGSCDVLIQSVQFIYIFELKLNSSAKKALEQIFKKGYLDPFQSDRRKKIAIGINFSSEERKIKEYLMK